MRIRGAGDDQRSLTLRGNLSTIHGVAYSPDGRTLASAGADRTVRIWDVATGQEVRTLRGHTSYVSGVAYSPDGRTFASASHDHTIKLWDPTTGRLLHTLFGRVGRVLGVAFSPDGRTLASAGDEPTVRTWDVATGRELRALHGHAAPVICIAYSPDGRTLASTSVYPTIELWDAASGRGRQTLRGHTGGIYGVAYSRDGRTLASAGYDQTVKVWDAATGDVLHTLVGHRGWVRSVAFSPDGRRIASASADQTIRLWDTATGQELIFLPGHAGEVCGLAFSPDGWTLASGSYDQTMKLWEAAPSSPDDQSRRQARGVLELLFVRSSTAGQVRDRIRHDPTLGADVRRRALDLAEPYERSLVAHAAERAVSHRFADGMFRPEVLESLRGDAALSDAVRRCALDLAGDVPEDAFSLDAVSWSVVHRPDAEAAAYRRALRQAELACRLVPRDSEFLTTLGAAQYRSGNDTEAVATLTLAGQTPAPADSVRTEVRLAVLALAQHRLGRPDEARSTLARLRALMNQPGWVRKETARAAYREIAALERELAFPADAFAP